jgi:hypothetical protein
MHRFRLEHLDSLRMNDACIFARTPKRISGEWYDTELIGAETFEIASVAEMPKGPFVARPSRRGDVRL